MKNFHFFTFLFVLFITGGLCAQTTTVPFYIMIGQSNLGWATANDMNTQQAASYKGLIPNTEIWNPAVGAFSAVWQPLNVGVNTAPENLVSPTQFGPEASLFASLQNQNNTKRLVYKQSQGGTTLAGDWRPPSAGQYIWQAGYRYQQFTQWLELAVTQAEAKGYKLDLKGIIWMQGEDDSKTLADASAYLQNLQGFFTALDNIWKGYINRFNFPANPYKKVVGRIYAPTGYPYRELVRSAQQAYCDNPANNAVMINCDSYPLQDWVHYNATGQIQFGNDIFNSTSFEGPAIPVAPSVTFSGKVFLQGAYNPQTGLMNNALNTNGILQASATAHPYSGAPFTYTGTEVVGSGFYAAHNNIVDWVLIELRDAIDATKIVARRAAFVQRDGTLVETDGSNTQITFAGVPKGNYYVAIAHRNHLRIRSASTVNFSTGAGSYDFTTAASKSHQNLAYTSTALMGNVYVMRGGNANLNVNVKYNGPSNDQDFIQNIQLRGSISMVMNGVYSSNDINMDGNIKTNGPSNDQNFLLNIVLGGFIGSVYNEQM
ncbi:hypothetical protein EXU57_19480 [Segetibacter sp. 3557_3]|nr:sialate O-acetylesterase [Segetibacter sp. 3557_3]TDH21383.1 hypothetical protein EXU57_19480 [Segetibacter sp. 3557_3]